MYGCGAVNSAFPEDSLPFKGRAGVGMGLYLFRHPNLPILLLILE
jgi:hypothetical protein